MQTLLKTQQTLQQGPGVYIGHKSLSSGKIQFQTKKHGRVTFKFSRYEDPNLRNSVNMSLSKNVVKDSMYGALIYATNPKYITLKKATTIPKIPNKKTLKKMMNSDYYKPLDKTKTKQTFMGIKTNDNLLVRKGRTKQFSSISDYK